MNTFTDIPKKVRIPGTGVFLFFRGSSKGVQRHAWRIVLSLLIGTAILISATPAHAITVPEWWSCALSGSGIWDSWSAVCATNLITDGNGCTVNGSGGIPTALCAFQISSCPYGEKGMGILEADCHDSGFPPCGAYSGFFGEWDRDCTLACPDGVIDTVFGETCDGGNFGPATCFSETGGARPNGNLSCNSCSIDSSACTASAGPVPGCTNPAATNYNPSATVDDGSCVFAPVPGCTNPAATNYNPSATVDDGSCIFLPSQVCLNGVREGTESCDGSDLGSNDCTTVGFTGGSLSCMSDCSFNTTACTGGLPIGYFCYGQPSCVAGVYSCGPVANFNKQTPCNYSDNTSPVFQCADGFESNPMGTWPCSLPPLPTCNIGASPSSISDGQTSNLSWTSTDATNGCFASGAWGGPQGTSGGPVQTATLNNPPQSLYTFALTCFNAAGSGSCSDDVSVIASVPPSCGDTSIQAPETCDNGPLNGSWPAACSDVTCTPNSNPCGNGTIDTILGETCDGGNFGSPPRTCSDETGGTLPGGNLSCTGSCTISTSACTPPVVTCGDGTTQNPPETCDDGPLNGSWPAACSDISCTPNTDPCGNSILDLGEVCDGGSFVLSPATCSNATGGALPGGNLSCTNSCQTVSTAACTPPIPVTVVVSANPPSGFAPLTVDLTAIVSGPAAAPITYRFDCTNDGVADIVVASLSTSDTEACIYPVAGSYTARIRVIDALGATAQNTISITVNTGAPIVDIKANGVDALTVPDGSTINLTWTIVNATATCTASGAWSGSRNGNASNGPRSFGPLAGPASYVYQIDCSNAGGSTSDSVTVVVSAPPPPAAPANPNPCSGPAFPGTGCTGVTIYTDLDWADSSGATSYDVYFGACPAPVFIGNTAISFFNLPPLNYVTQYCWRIVAKNAGGNTIGPLWTFQSELPAPPTCIASASQAYVLKGQSVDISWNCSSPAGFTSMTLSASPPPPALQGIVPPGNGTQTFIPQTTTNYTITACNAGGCGSDIATVGMYSPRIKEVLPKP